MLGDCKPEAEPEPKKKAPTVKHFIDKIFKPTFIDQLNPRTAENYTQMIHYNIVPFLGTMRIDDVTVADIQRFYDWMATGKEHGRQKNLNKMTIKRVGGLTSRIFRVAQEMGIIESSPVKKTLLTIRGEEAGHHKQMPDEVYNRIKRDLVTLENTDERLFFAVLTYTGMRPEEVRGLRWEDINFEAQYAEVKRAVTFPTNNHPEVGKTKTAYSVRTVLVPSALIELLSPFRQPHGFVFGGEKPWCYSHYHRTTKAGLLHLGLQNYCCYDFRSTYGSQLKELGMSSALVADLMGHADTRMVETVYARTRHEGILKQLRTVEKLSCPLHLIYTSDSPKDTPV